MTTGPVEYLIVGFPDNNRFTGEIASELEKLVRSDLIRVLDLVFVAVDADGDVTALELSDHEDVALFEWLDDDVGGLVTDEDLEHVAAALAPGSSAALLLWEDRWATGFVEALRGSGAVLIESARIPAELIAAAEAGA